MTCSRRRIWRTVRWC